MGDGDERSSLGEVGGMGRGGGGGGWRDRERELDSRTR